MADEQYLRYQKQFKLDCILKAVSGGLALLAIIFLLFLPNFCIQILGIELIRFSLFSETLTAFSGFSNGFSVSSVFGIYQIFALVFALLGAVMSVVTLVKNIINLTDLKRYALEQYDNIKKGVTNKKSIYGRFNATSLFISAIMMEILYVVMMKVFSNMFGNAQGEISVSNLAEVNGVTGFIAFFIIFTLGFIAITIFNKIQIRKVKYEILKEDYGVSLNNEQV